MSSEQTIGVLVIDDEKEVCFLLCNYLKNQGYKADFSTSMNEGLNKISSHEHDVVLLDINLQDGDGLNLLRQKKIPDDVCTIVMSALRDKEQEALELGASRFIAKPFDMDRVINTINELQANGCGS